MSMPPPPVSLSVATAIQTTDGTWYTIANSSLSAVIDPSFTDPVSGLLITPGDVWVQFATATGYYACPLRSVAAVQLGAPVT